MSLMALSRAMKKHGAWVGGVFAFLMLVVSLSSLGGALGGGGGRGSAAARDTGSAPADKTVATVGDIKVTRADLDHQLEQMTQGTPLDPSLRDQYRYMVLNQSYKQQAAMAAAAKAAGVAPTEADLNAEREKAWNANRSQVAQMLGLPPTATDSQIEPKLMQATGMGVDAFRKARITDDQVRLQLLQQGLVGHFKKEVKTNPDDVKKSYDEIQVRHILIMSGEKGLPDAQAKTKAEKILKEVQANPAKMADLANQYTEDPGNVDQKTHQKNGGLYTWAPASRYVSEFTQAALEAGVGKVFPQPVKTQFGYHIIKLEGERPGKDAPKDWDTNKQKYIDEFIEKQAQQKAMAAVQAQAPNIKVEITDPSLKTSQLEDEARTAPDPKAKDAKLNEALAELGKIKDDRTGTVAVRKAQILVQMNKTKEAITAYQEALTQRKSAETYIALAEQYIKTKDNTNAIQQLDASQKLLISDPQMMQRIAILYQEAGDQTKGKAALAKSAEMRKREQQIQEAQMKQQLDAIKAQAAAQPKPSASPAAKGASPSASPAAAASPATSPTPAATK